MRDKIFKNEKLFLVLLLVMALFVMGILCILRSDMKFTQHPHGTYSKLRACRLTDDPLMYLGDDFEVLEGFHTNLPIAILEIDTELPDYKLFKGSNEIVFDVDPYTTGHLTVIDTGYGNNKLTDDIVYDSMIKIKRKGHSSYMYDKKQYKIKALNPDGTDNKTSILGMGEGSEWVINGSLADKSMMRNYIAYRIASEIGGNNMSPDSRYCEVLMKDGDKLTYQGVFLLMESISRGDDRVNIDKYNPKNAYSSYIVKRDRKTSFDIMLNTYAREQGLELGREDPDADNWIAIKYPGQSKITQETIDYIEADFSAIERVLYSEEPSLYKIYDRYIDMDSFVDYFLINEFFGNYDAGEHSTYMHKNSGDVLYMGPVWDFDQAFNNSLFEELKTEDLAFEMQPMFKQLCNDKRFVRKLKERYTSLRANYMSEEHVFSLIDETAAYLKAAQVREWYRWADDYLDDSGTKPGNYNIADIVVKGVTLSRFNDEYTDEIYVMKKYIHEHGGMIQQDLTGILGNANLDTTVGGIQELMFIAMITLVLLPSYIIQRKG